MFLCQICQLLVVDGTRSGNYESIGGVMGVNVVDDIIASHIANVLFRAKDGLAQSCEAEGRGTRRGEERYYDNRRHWGMGLHTYIYIHT